MSTQAIIRGVTAVALSTSLTTTVLVLLRLAPASHIDATVRGVLLSFMFFSGFLIAAVLQIIAVRNPSLETTVGRCLYWLAISMFPLAGYALVREWRGVEHLCLLCVGLSLCVALLFWFTSSPVDTPASASVGLAGLLRSPAHLTLLGASLAAVAGGGVYVAAKTAEAQALRGAGELSAGGRDGAELEAWLAVQPRVDIEGRSGASVDIVQFSDFQCPACRAAHMSMQAFGLQTDATSADVRFVLKDYPLEPECNPYVVREIHSLACETGAAVRLARRSGQADALAAWFFDNQKGLTNKSLWDAATRIANVRYDEATYRQVLAEIRRDVELGHSLNVNVVPTFFFNGVRVRGALSPEQVGTIVRAETAKRASQGSRSAPTQ